MSSTDQTPPHLSPSNSRLAVESPQPVEGIDMATMSPPAQSSPRLGNSSIRQNSSSSSPLLAQTASNNMTASPTSQSLHPGCVFCGIVSSASVLVQQRQTTPSPTPTPTPPRLDSNRLAALSEPARTASPDLHRTGSSELDRVGLPRRQRPPPSPLASSTSSTGSPPRPTAHRAGTTGTAALNEVEVCGRRIIYRDDIITVFPAEGKEALCPNGRHLVAVFNQHLASVYDFGPSNIPMLASVSRTIMRLLLSTAASLSTDSERGFSPRDIRIGFVNGMPRDPRFPYPHLHIQAFLGPFDKTLPGSTLWRRNVVFGTLNWWGLDDLIAEMREETSNNRIKSGYDDRDTPLDRVPEAGAYEASLETFDRELEAHQEPPEMRALQARQVLAPQSDRASPRSAVFKGKDGLLAAPPRGAPRPQVSDPYAMSPSPKRNDSAATIKAQALIGASGDEWGTEGPDSGRSSTSTPRPLGVNGIYSPADSARSSLSSQRSKDGVSSSEDAARGAAAPRVSADKHPLEDGEFEDEPL